MKNNILKFLFQPYPFYYQGKTLWVIMGLSFIMTLFFSYFFEPFEVYIPEHKMDFFWISFIHSFSPVIIIALLSLFTITLETEESWNVRKELILVSLFFLLVGITQFLIRDIIYDNPNNWSWRYLYEEVRNTFLVGTLFASILVPLNFNRLNYKNVKNSNTFKTFESLSKSSANATILIETQVKKDNLKLDINNLLFVKADGNYVEIYLNEETITKVLKRISIKELGSILKPHPNILKTHRSYLVNLYHVKNVTGNAQGYKLGLNNYDKKIPVSRNMINDFNTRMNTI